MSSFELGWGARPLKEQFPDMDEEKARNFDEDNKALIRLRIRGYLTDSARDSALKRIVKAIQKELIRG